MSGNPDINFDLLSELQVKPHPHQTTGDLSLPTGVGEILTEALVCQHLLDMAGVPYEKGYRGDVDARTYLLVMEVFRLRERMGRLVTWHSRESGPSGTVGDFCNECGHTWPCDSYRMATGTYEDEGSER